jgi:hypothetical protein
LIERWFRERIAGALEHLEPDHPAAVVLRQTLAESDWSARVCRLPVRACEICGGRYQPVRVDQRRCSDPCRSEAARRRLRGRYVPKRARKG